MKWIFLIYALILCLSCSAKNLEKVNIKKNKVSRVYDFDTLRTLKLDDRKYGGTKYEILILRDISTNKRFIEIFSNNVLINTINLPNSEEVKNFSVFSLSETRKGFMLATHWGGGNYFYRRFFYFKNMKSHFYLSKIKKEYFNFEFQKTTKKKNIVNPLIPIEKFDISVYVENE